MWLPLKRFVLTLFMKTCRLISQFLSEFPSICLMVCSDRGNQCFNFLVNKKQINRYLLIKLVEYFKLTRFNYTWSGIGRQFDLTEIIDEWNMIDPLHTHFNDNLRNCILSPILLDKFFIHFQKCIAFAFSNRIQLSKTKV